MSSSPALPPDAERQHLAWGLRLCAEELWPGRERRAIVQLANQIERGAEPAALGTLRGASPILRELVRQGLSHSTLAVTLDSYLADRRRAAWMWSQLTAALLYPIFAFILAAFLLTTVLLLVTREFASVYTDFGVALPGVTVLLMAIADSVQTLGPSVLTAFLAAAGLACLGWGIRPLRRQCLRVLRFVPILGAALQNMAAAEFCSRLALLIDADIPLPDALRALSKTVHDPSLADGSDQLAQRLEQGEPLESVHRVPGMPQRLLSVFRWQRDPRMFSEALRAMADVFASQSQLRIEQFCVVFPPFVLGGVAGLAVLTVFALFLPMVKLLNELA